jgi:hypothetical protein
VCGFPFGDVVALTELFVDPGEEADLEARKERKKGRKGRKEMNSLS